MRTLWMAVVIVAATAVGSAQQDAKAFLKQVQEKYRNAKSWEISIEINAELRLGSDTRKLQSSSTVAMQRPNLVALKANASPPIPSREVYSDGKTVYEYVPSAKQYMKQPAPPNFDGMNVGLLGDAALLLALLSEDVDKLGQDTKIQFRGAQTVGGKQTRIVEINQSRGFSNRTVKLYIGAQDKLVYRVELNETSRPPQGGQGGGQAPQQFTTKATANIRYISFDKPIPASRFRFTPPKDAKEVQPPQQGQPMTPPQPPGRGR